MAQLALFFVQVQCVEASKRRLALENQTDQYIVREITF